MAYFHFATEVPPLKSTYERTKTLSLFELRVHTYVDIMQVAVLSLSAVMISNVKKLLETDVVSTELLKQYCCKSTNNPGNLQNL